jgi:hypothetical protein
MADIAAHSQYKTLVLAPSGSSGLLTATFEDGQNTTPVMLSKRLNELAREGWEVQLLIPPFQGSHLPTLILRRP